MLGYGPVWLECKICFDGHMVESSGGCSRFKKLGTIAKGLDQYKMFGLCSIRYYEPQLHCHSHLIGEVHIKYIL